MKKSFRWLYKASTKRLRKKNNKLKKRKRKQGNEPSTWILNILYVLFLAAFLVLFTKYYDALELDSSIGSKLNVICIWILVVGSTLLYTHIIKLRGLILLLLSFLVSASIIPEARIIVTLFAPPLTVVLLMAAIMSEELGNGLMDNGPSLGAGIIGFGILFFIITIIASIIWFIVVIKNASYFGYDLS